MSRGASGGGLPWAAALLGGAALVSGAAALALGISRPGAGRRLLDVPPALADSRVDVGGGRRIHLRCGGSGSPTVVLTGGAGATTGSWRLVQPEVARRTRACSWDRAGFGASDGSPAPQSAAETAADLARALTAAGISGPLLLVGHSLGAYETLLFADAHPGRVAGMVLVDPSTPGMFRQPTGGADAAELAARMVLAPYARPYAACLDALASGAPLPADPALRCTRDTPPAKLRTAVSFFDSAGASSEAVVNPRRAYGAMPLIVLTAGAEVARTDDPDPARAAALRTARAWGDAHDALARLSSRGANRYVPDSGHMIQSQRPAAVVEAVDDVLEQLGGG